MCLFTKQAEPFIAQEDIECIKILREEDGKYLTPFRDFPVEFNKVLEAAGNDEVSKLHNHPMFKGHYSISEGYFHVCDSGESARKHAQDMKITYSRHGIKCPNLFGFKAIIPKGSRYYVGVRGDLCSDKLIIMK